MSFPMVDVFESNLSSFFFVSNINIIKFEFYFSVFTDFQMRIK